MQDSEAVLWRSWRERRDEHAFAALVRPHVEFATAFARRMGCRPADADDVVQRSLVALARETRDKPARVGIRAWLGRSVLHEALTSFRAQRRRATPRDRRSPRLGLR